MVEFERVDCVSESNVLVTGLDGETRLDGRLRFDPNAGISLEVHGVARGGLTAVGAHRPTIVGQMFSGPPFTLLHCRSQGVRTGGAGMAEVRIVAEHLLVGIHLEDPAIAPFDEIRVSLTSLNEWFGDSPIAVNWQDLPDGESGREVTITCARLPRFGFSPIRGGPSLLSDQDVRTSETRLTDAGVHNNFALRLIPRAPFGVESCAEELFRLQAFLSLLCGHQAFYESVRLYRLGPDKDERQRNVVRYLTHFAQPAGRDGERHEGVLFPLPAVRDVLPDLWAAWGDRYAYYRSAVELYTSTELFGHQLLNFQFLAIMQALETLHRNRFGGAFTSDAEFKTVCDALTAAIPPNTDASLRSALKARLRYANEFSLRRRLKDLAGRLSSDVSNSIDPSVKVFFERAVKTRNYLTHYDQTDKTEAFHGGALFWATRLLRWFFLSVLLTDMGLPSATLVGALSRAGELKHIQRVLTVQ